MSGRFAASVCSSFAAVLLPTLALAQESSPPTEAAMRYGKVKVADAQPFCWPSAVVSPPKFEDVLQQDQVVGIGRTEGTFVQVLLPLGPVGYVSKRFAKVEDDGTVRTDGTKVAFRYRTVTTEAPVAYLENGSELFVVGDQDEWWRARLPSVEAWLPQDQVAIGAPGDAELAAAWAKSKREYEEPVQQRLEEIRAGKQRAAQDKADGEALQLVEDAFQKELAKRPVSDQNFEGLVQALDKFEPTLAENSGVKPLVASLRKRIEMQKVIVEATAIVEEPPKPSSEPVLEPQPKDELERFQSIGFLRYESRLGGMGTYYLEKGGVRLHHITCATGRYDLALFVNCEIGVQGPSRSPAAASFRVMDVERLEVLGHARK